MTEWTDIQCPFCGGDVSEGDLFIGQHETGCDETLELYTDDATGETKLRGRTDV
jgi:hypothetical protein